MIKFILTFLLVFLSWALAEDWYENGAFYQIYPRSFKDGNGDGIGDLKGITEKMSYLKNLGIAATWLSPIFQSPQIDYGYDISDFEKIDPAYGNMADFEALMIISAGTGVKVLMDFVPNHSSDEHEWFQKSVNGEEPYKNYYVWHPGKIDPNNATNRLAPCNWLSVGFGTAWTWNDKRKAFYYHQFHPKQPDLNYREPKVHEEMKKVLKFWLDKGIAGFRIDAVTHMYEIAPDANNLLPDEPPVLPLGTNPLDYSYLDHIYSANQDETYGLIYDWRDVLEDYKKLNGGDTRILMTESYSSIELVRRYYTNGMREGAQLPFNFELMKQLNKDSKAQDYKNAITSFYNVVPTGYTTNWVLGNHDGSRIATRFGTNFTDILNCLLQTLPGASVTYLGDEIGMTDVCVTFNTQNVSIPCSDPANIPFTREFVRAPFQWDNSTSAGFSTATKTWLPVASNYKEVNLKLQESQEGSHINIYKKLLKLRSHDAIKSREFSIEVLSDNVLVYKRQVVDKTKESLMIVLNLSGKEETIELYDSTEYPSVMSVKVSRTARTEITSKKFVLGAYDFVVAAYLPQKVSNSSKTLQISSLLIFLGALTHFLRKFIFN